MAINSPFGTNSIFDPTFEWMGDEKEDKSKSLSIVFFSKDTISTLDPSSILLNFEIRAKNITDGFATIVVFEKNTYNMPLPKASINKFIKKNGSEMVSIPIKRNLLFPELDDDKEYSAVIECDGMSISTLTFKINDRGSQTTDFRKNIKELKPSSKFYLFLKEKEGLGYNVVRNDKKEIIRVLPYDDGGKMGIGFATIGYGHLIEKKPFEPSNPKHAKWKDGLTMDEVEQLLVQDVNTKIKLLINGLGDGKTKGIKVKLLQREFDALLAAIFNGGYGDTLENTINKGVENISNEEIFKAFLERRNAGKSDERGIIKRRAMEADVFVNDNWMPFPSEKFKNDNEYIKAYQKFLKTGVLPILFFILSILFQSCTNIKDPKISITKAPQIQRTPFQSYHENSSILCDSNDTMLNHLDTVLLFSDKKIFYEVKINKTAVKIVASRWSELPDNKSLYTDTGYQRDGFVYTKGVRDSTYDISYKILMGKGLFIWDGQNWKLVNAGGE